MFLRIMLLFGALLIAGCASTTPVEAVGKYSGYVWTKSESNDEEYPVTYSLGVCSVHVGAHNQKVRFEAINDHWPEGRLEYVTTVEKDEYGQFEVSHSHFLLFDRRRDRTYPEYSFAFENYDVFYSLCFKAAQQLPDYIQEFLRRYSTETYKEYMELQKERERSTTRIPARRFVPLAFLTVYEKGRPKRAGLLSPIKRGRASRRLHRGDVYSCPSCAWSTNCREDRFRWLRSAAPVLPSALRRWHGRCEHWSCGVGRWS